MAEEWIPTFLTPQQRGRNTLPDYVTILFAVRDNVAHLMLNRPEAANSLNPTLSAEMMDAVIRCEEDAEVRALVISGTGRMLCAGADLKNFSPERNKLESRVSLFHVALSRIARKELRISITGESITLHKQKGA